MNERIRELAEQAGLEYDFNPMLWLKYEKFAELIIQECIGKKEWVGLTDVERLNIREWQEIQKELGPVWAPMMLYLYLAIEKTLKEKNT